MTSILFRPLGLLIGLLALLSGCMSPDRAGAPFQILDREVRLEPRISAFLTLQDPRGPSIRMEVADFELYADEGLWLPLASGPLQLDSEAIGAGQVFLGGEGFPPGRYHRLRLRVTEASMRQAEGDFAPVLAEPVLIEIAFAEVMTLEPEDSRTLLVTWDLENSLLPDGSFRPNLFASPPLNPLREGLVYAACPDIDTVFVVRADKDWVVDSFGILGGPAYLAVDPLSSGQRLYVLTPRDRKIKLVDLSSYRVIDFFPAPLSDATTFMVMGPAGRDAYLLDERSGYISRIDLSTGNILARTQVDLRPKYAIYLEEQGALAVSLALSQEVSLLDPVSLREIGTIPSGNSPWGLAAAENRLYIADYGDNTISVADLGSGSKIRTLSVGFGPALVLKAGAQIYVGNYLEGSLSVLMPEQFGVFQQIYGLERPREMVFHEFYRRLYVGDEGAGGLAVVDVNANHFLGHIILGANPLGLAVIQ